MKFLLIPFAIYCIITASYLFIESRILTYPFQDTFSFLPNHAIQSIIIMGMGISVLFDLKSLNKIFIAFQIFDISFAIFTATSLIMQDLSEALQRIGFSLIILGILFETQRVPEKYIKKKVELIEDE